MISDKENAKNVKVIAKGSAVALLLAVVFSLLSYYTPSKSASAGFYLLGGVCGAVFLGGIAIIALGWFAEKAKL